MANPPSKMLICNAEERAALLRVALGVESAYMVILNASVVNVTPGKSWKTARSPSRGA